MEQILEMIVLFDECVLPGQRFIDLNPFQKRWLANSVISGQDTSSGIARRYGFKANSVLKIVSRMRRSGKLEGRTGRPRALDEDSHKVIVDAVSNDEINGDGDLRDKICSEYYSTMARKRPNRFEELFDEDKLPKVPKRTVDRYLRNFLIQNEDIDAES